MVSARRRTEPRRPATGRQERGDRTRELLIAETVQCIREEGFSAASTRHIIERAGVSWGVIQHHFGDRDGLLTAVIEDAVDRLVETLNGLSEAAPEHSDTLGLVRAVWDALANPRAMAGLEILISTKDMRSALDESRMDRLGAALAGLTERVNVGEDTGAVGVGLMLWTTPVAMMIAEMFARLPLATEEAQRALADLIDQHR